MIDIETLGTAPGSVILSIGAVTFDAEAGTLGAEFYSAIDPQSAVDAGLRMDVSTLKWWMTQSDDARRAVFAGNQPLDCVLREFGDFVRKVDASRVWAKPPSFDLVLLEAAFQACRLHVPWHYRSLRDVRTLLDITGTRATYVGTAHNALDDARSQALSVIDAYRNGAIRNPNEPKEITRPAVIAVFGGEPSEPSSDAGGAKMDDCSHPGRSDDMSGHMNAKSEQATRSSKGQADE